MFIGHFGLALASRKKLNPPSLAMMFMAVQFLDLLWPIFCLAGIEEFRIEPGNTTLTPLNFSHYHYSHSLLMAVIWGMIFGSAYFLFTKNRQASIILSGLVISHWILDLLVHRPDLPLTPFTDLKTGLGLWNHPLWAILIESGLFLAGTLLYYRGTNPKRKISFWLLISTFTIIHIMNLTGPPPPSAIAVSLAANLVWLFILWAWQIEKT